MAYKHQAESYRNRGGVKYLSWGDWPNRAQANAERDRLRSMGFLAFVEHHPDGYTRIFVESGALPKLS